MGEVLLAKYFPSVQVVSLNLTFKNKIRKSLYPLVQCSRSGGGGGNDGGGRRENQEGQG